MRVSDFDYRLPDSLVARYPAEPRSSSRLLVVEREELTDRRFTDFPACLRSGDLLVLNDTRVIRARIPGRKPTGGRIEVFVERIEGRCGLLARVRASKGLRIGGEVELGSRVRGVCVGREGELHRIELDSPAAEVLERHGEVPLPPYLGRSAEPSDADRYQTVYARRAGAVAAPTAGLHFDRRMFERLSAAGVERSTLTLHVGSGTYQPIRGDDPDGHRMHGEAVEVSEGLCRQVEAAKARGGRVVAVGTTCVRALETAAGAGRLAPWKGITHLFIRPGFEFRCVDALLTNFHQPRSSLLLLVAAFAGRERGARCLPACRRRGVPVSELRRCDVPAGAGALNGRPALRVEVVRLRAFPGVAGRHPVRVPSGRCEASWALRGSRSAY